MESLRDHSCAIATPAGRGKLEQPYQMPAKPASPMNGTACPPSPIPSLQNCYLQDTAAPCMLQTPHNAVLIRFPNSLKISIVYVCVLMPFNLLLRISDGILTSYVFATWTIFLLCSEICRTLSIPSC